MTMQKSLLGNFLDLKDRHHVLRLRLITGFAVFLRLKLWLLFHRYVYFCFCLALWFFIIFFILFLCLLFLLLHRLLYLIYLWLLFYRNLPNRPLLLYDFRSLFLYFLNLNLSLKARPRSRLLFHLSFRCNKRLFCYFSLFSYLLPLLLHLLKRLHSSPHLSSPPLKLCRQIIPQKGALLAILA